MKITTLFSLALCVATCNAIWLYTAPSYNLAYDLYAIDTTTYTVYTIGPIRDSDGDLFTVGAMYYSNSTGLIYATGLSRVTNPLKQNGLFAINPLTAQGASIMHNAAFTMIFRHMYSCSCLKTEKRAILLV